ncbi:MAG TPA: hypothetical protein VGO93_07295 [Candidatus Xenobia bacterium]|jgi:hypothetical protein
MDKLSITRPTPAPAPAFRGWAPRPEDMDRVDWSAAAAAGCPFARTMAGQTPAPAAVETKAATVAPSASPTWTDGAGSDKPITHWTPAADSTPAERAEFERGITELQNRLLDAGKVPHLDRGFHQKQTWGGKGHVVISDKLPQALRSDALKNAAGQEFTAAVRFSNGQGCPYMDALPDVRGMAVKMNINGQQVDLLATNSITFARDAAQFMRFAEVSGTKQAEGGLKAAADLSRKIAEEQYDGKEAARILANLTKATSKPIAHPAAETYWTQPVQVGNMVGRFVFTPASGANTHHGLIGELTDHDYLRHNMETDLENGPVKMHVGFEAFTDEAPIHDATVHGNHVTWNVGDIVLDPRSADGAARAREEHDVSMMAFNPSNGMKMAGTMNESNRGAIYQKSAENRGAWTWDNPEVQSFFGH